MQKILTFILFVSLVVTGCRSEFEKIRTSNQPELMLNKANEFYSNGEYANAQTLYELVIPYYRGKKEAEELFYNFAYCHYYLGEYILASHYFNNFARTFYNSKWREEAAYMAAYSNLEMSPNHRLDQSHTQKAIDEFQAFTNKFPESDRIGECNDIIDELRDKLELKAFEQGKLYYDLKNYNSCITSFDNMLKDFPESPNAEEVRFIILKSSYEWAENSIYNKKEERFRETIKRYNQFIKKYPSSKYASQVDSIKERAEEALKNYTDV
jgi:outer membrane protein assembly factor BamD